MPTRIPIFSPTERRIRREARSATLRERARALRQAGWTFARIGQALGVSTTRAAQIVRKAERLSRNPHWSDVLPARARHLLQIHGWDQLDEIAAARRVAQLFRRELMGSSNFGRGACAAIMAWLARHGLSTGQNERGRPLTGAPLL
jgi:hypothetical protein